MSDLTKHLINSGQDRNAVNEAATAVIAQMGRAKAMERPRPIPKKLPMTGVKKNVVAKKPVVKKIIAKKPVVKKVAKKSVFPTETKSVKAVAKNVKPVKGKGKDLKVEKGKDVAKKPSKKWIWILVAGLVVLLGAGGFAVWWFLFR